MSPVLLTLIVFGSGSLSGCHHDADSSSRLETTAPTHPIEMPVKLLTPPSGPGSMAPRLTSGPSGALLTWLQSTDPTATEGASKVTRLMVAKLQSDAPDSSTSEVSWSVPQQIVQGDDFFANWADLPAAVEGPDGTRWAHWLEKLGADTYAYGVQIARSSDGESWQPSGLLHDDASPTEHGFVSYVPLADGVRAFWLDGRAMAGGSHGDAEQHSTGSMQLRTARLAGPGEPPSSTLLDDRVCECCQTDAALTDSGPIVVYRDRDASETRDVAVVRATDDRWSEPTPLHADGWQIHGCPVNGPAVAANDRHVAVAWFTGADERPRVQVAFSDDSGASFGAPIEVDSQKPIGRVDVVLGDTGQAYVSWLATAGEHAEIRLQRVASNGQLGEALRVTETTVKRSAGVPRMVRQGGEALLTWVEDKVPSQIQVGAVPLE